MPLSLSELSLEIALKAASQDFLESTMHVECSSVPITSFSDELSAHAFANSLQEHGISATVQGGFTANFRGGGPGNVSVLVDAASMDHARRILAQVNEARKSRASRLQGNGNTTTKIRLVVPLIALNLVGLACYLAYVVLTSQQ